MAGKQARAFEAVRAMQILREASDWIPYDELLERVAETVPPGRALRTAEAEIQNRSSRTPRESELPSREEMITRGQRRLAYRSIKRMLDWGEAEDTVVNRIRMIRQGPRLRGGDSSLPDTLVEEEPDTSVETLPSETEVLYAELTQLRKEVETLRDQLLPQVEDLARGIITVAKVYRGCQWSWLGLSPLSRTCDLPCTHKALDPSPKSLRAPLLVCREHSKQAAREGWRLMRFQLFLTDQESPDTDDSAV